MVKTINGYITEQSCNFIQYGDQIFNIQGLFTYIIPTPSEVYDLEEEVGHIIASITEPSMVNKYVESLEHLYKYYEHNLVIPLHFADEFQVWKDEITKKYGKVCISSNPARDEYARYQGYKVLEVPKGWADFLSNAIPTSTEVTSITYATFPPSPEESKKIEAIKRLTSDLFNDFPEVRVADIPEEDGTLGWYDYNEDLIVIARRALKYNALPLKVFIHEMVHRTTKADDCTREFASYLEDLVLHLLVEKSLF